MKNKKMNLYIGGGLMALAVISMFIIDWEKEAPEMPPNIRPLKTMVVGGEEVGGGQTYPGQVRANQEVDLSFEVSGKIVEIKVKKGDQVKKGQVLARLDPRDFENAFQSAKAEAKRAGAQYERVKEAAAVQAVSQQDLTDAKAAYDQAIANQKIKKKALDDTKIRARFDGVIATRFVENFQNIQAKEPILSLQDVASIEIRVNIPERRIAQGKKGDAKNLKFFATFEFLPDRQFDVSVKEFDTEADPTTQTFEVTFVMPRPEDVNILPGMTVSITEKISDEKRKVKKENLTEFLIPIGAVPIDENGKYFVWSVEPVEGESGVFSVRKTPVDVGEMARGSILVKSGINATTRIATAGVHFLQEGQKVTLFSLR